MRLTWRDAVTTILAVSVGAVTLAVTEEWDWPLFGSTRAAVGAVGAIGLAMCIVGGSRDVSPMKGTFGVVATALGVAAFVLIVLGVITGSESVLITLVGVIGVLWFTTTLRHAIVPATAAPQRG
jgi:FtsH-binding integral membrane protein